jgi:hypothetical protein
MTALVRTSSNLPDPTDNEKTADLKPEQITLTLRKLEQVHLGIHVSG